MESLYRELGSNLKLFIIKHIGNEFDAEDILQEVYIKIHNKISTLRDRNKLHSWVYQITRNAIVDFKRKINSINSDNEIPDYTYIEKESDEMLAQGLLLIIKSLPEKQSEILYLKNYKELKNSEICKILNITPSALKSRLHRARKDLKNRLLEFCHFELDSYGNIVDYEPKDCFICYMKNKFQCK